MKGEQVTVEYRNEIGKDSFNTPIYSTLEIEVDGVLVAPGASADIQESNRPEGVLIAYTLYFPKTFSEDLKGLRVKVRDRWCRVVGKPALWTTSPTRYWMVASVEALDG